MTIIAIGALRVKVVSPRNLDLGTALSNCLFHLLNPEPYAFVSDSDSFTILGL